MVEKDLPQELREGVISGEYCRAEFWGYLKTVKKPGTILLNLATYLKLLMQFSLYRIQMQGKNECSL